MKLIQSSIVLVCALVLAACGGGGGGSPSADAMTPSGADTSTTVPVSATASVQSFATYVGTLPADDVREPLDTVAVMPPVSDSDEPAVL